MNKRLIQMILAALVLAGTAHQGLAQIEILEKGKKTAQARADKGPALRLGYGWKPDQFVVGLRLATANSKRAPRIVPSVDFGFGGDIKTTIAINLDFLWRLRVEGGTRLIIGGGGATLAYINPAGPDERWAGGISAIAGIRLSKNNKRPINFLVRMGYGDIPNLRLLLELGK